MINDKARYENLKLLHKRMMENQWIFAKTMPRNPHFYTLKKTWGQVNDFVDSVTRIRDFGYDMKYGASWYRVLNLDDKRYWTMGAPPKETTLINRALLSKDSGHNYDKVASAYDQLFSDEDSLKENKEIISKLSLNGSVLDIGCGTGLLLDTASVKRENYLGIDPSLKMLERLNEKHPGYKVINSYFEDFALEGYDNIIGLFGVMNYIKPETLWRIREKVTANGNYFLMFYKPGYYPITHIKTGFHFEFYKTNQSCIPFDLKPYNDNYLIATNLC